MGKGLRAIVLAAGKGTRLNSEESDLPKVMRLACGKPLLSYVLDALSFLKSGDITIVVGYKKEAITKTYKDYLFAIQKEQLGTGHAVMAAEDVLKGYDGDVLICLGDMPLIKQDTYESLIREHVEKGYECTILTGTSQLEMEFGKVIRDTDGKFSRIVEHRDCTREERLITELNSGVYVFKSQPLLQALGELHTNNDQHEYYLTDVPAILMSKGAAVGLLMRELNNEIIGVNTKEELAYVEKTLSGSD